MECPYFCKRLQETDYAATYDDADDDEGGDEDGGADEGPTF